MAENKKYNSILVSGRKDETLTYSRYIKDEETGKSVKESLDGKINTTDMLETHQIKDGAITNEKLADDSVSDRNIQAGSVGTNEIGDQVITIEKIAEEVWGKLQDEYLSVNGSNGMMADLNMNGFALNNLDFIYSNKSDYPTYYLQNHIELFDDYCGISFVIGNSDSANPDIKCSMNEDGEWVATGFKTKNQSSLGLLGNEGSVVTAMTDSDIDSCISSVFG